MGGVLWVLALPRLRLLAAFGPGALGLTFAVAEIVRVVIYGLLLPMKVRDQPMTGWSEFHIRDDR